MSFLPFTVHCAICDDKASFRRVKVADNKWLCSDCSKEAGYTWLDILDGTTTNSTPEYINYRTERLEESTKLLTHFTTTTKVGSYIEFDENRQQWLVSPTLLERRDKAMVYHFNEITHFELHQDDVMIAHGGVDEPYEKQPTSTATDDEACKNLYLLIFTNAPFDNVIRIDFIKSRTLKSSILYKTQANYASSIVDTLHEACEAVKAS